MQTPYSFLSIRAFTLLLFLTSAFATLAAQTTLAPGDAAFTLLNLEGNNDDAFGFVLLTDVVAGTVIHVTDREYESGTGFPEITEGLLTITFDQAFTCATEVFIIDGNPATAEYDFESSVAGISVSPNTDNGFQLSTAGETLIMFQGANLTNPCNSCFVTALANTGVGFGVAATGSGDLPPGLTVGTSAMAMSANPDGNEWDNIKYDCSTAQADPAVLRAALATPANWMTDDTAPLPTTSCGFSCSAVCIAPVIDSVTVVDCPGGPFATAAYMVHGQLNGAASWEWRVPTVEGQACADQNPIATGEQIFVFSSNPQWIHHVVAVGGCITEEVCFPYVPNEALGQPTFAPLANVCETAGIQTGLGGGSPTGGVYSGTGVTDDGNGMTFSFNPSVGGAGSENIVYMITISGNTACAGQSSFANQPLTVLTAPALATGSPVYNVNDGVQTGLGGGTPTGGVYSGAGVTDDANGMTYTFNPAIAGVGVTTVTYTVNNGNGCDGSATGTITVEATAVAGNECPGANDLNALFGQAAGEAQISGLYDNSTATTEASDPTTGFECFGEPDGGGGSPSLDNTLWFTFTGDGETYVITTVECSATDYIDDGDTQIAIYTGDCGSLTGVACNEDAPGTPPAGPYPAQVTFPTEDGVVYRMIIDGFSFNGAISDGEFCVQVTRNAAPAPTGNECPDANDLNALFGQPVGEAQTSGLYNNDDATTEPSDPANGFECFGEPDGGGASPSLDNTLWFTFTGDGETYVITTVECSATDYIDDGDTQIAIYTGDCGSLTGVACNEDAPGVPPAGPYPSQVTFPTEDGIVYQMLIDGFSFNGAISDGEFCVQVTRSTDVAVTNIDQTAIELFPNPTSGQVNINGVNAHRIDIYDHTGRLVMTQTSRTSQVDLDGLATGVYLLKIHAAEAVYSAKVVKE